MNINIAAIKNYEGKSLSIDCFVNVPGRPGDDFSIKDPVRVTGQIRNFGGTIEMNAEAKADLTMTCDRCAEEYSSALSFCINESFKEQESLRRGDEVENPDITYFSGDELELDDIIYSCLVLSLPSKHLCSPDCRGLCPICGANQNNSSCNCSAEVTDPRFDVLDSLKLDD